MNRCLRLDPHLIVVDNASGDEPESAARQWRGPTTFIALDENVGYGAANNIGVERAATEGIVLLNPDTELLDDGLEALVAAALSRTAIIGPRILNPDGSLQPSASGPPVGIWPWVGAIVPGAIAPRVLAAHTEPWRIRSPVRVTWLAGACLAAPRQVLRRLGPFDPAIELYGEDMDLGLRTRPLGIECIFAPQLATIRHVGGASAARRFDDAEERARKAGNRRAVIVRAYGARAERRGWRADRLRLALRIAAKRLLGRDAGRDRRELNALRATRQSPALGAAPAEPATGRPARS